MLDKPEACRACVGWSWPVAGRGYVPPDGTDTSKVLMVFEAAGEKEAAAGKPLVGKAGQTFTELLQRGGMNRSDFRLANVLSCRPPNNKLSGMPYAQAAISACAPNLDREIARMRPAAILAGGVVAFRRLLPELAALPNVGLQDAKGRCGARGYVHWSERYQSWVIPTFHPSHILRGKTGLSAIFIHDAQRAVKVAQHGFTACDTSFFLLDPPLQDAQEWARQFELSLACGKVKGYLADDIETPGKGADEGELDLDSLDEPNYIITRCGYAYLDDKGYHVLSLPWDPQFLPVHRRLQGSQCPKLFHNKGFDLPRLASKMPVNGVIHDSMEAWHILNSDLPKGLGSITTYFCPDVPMWKHLSNERPAFYNGMDVFADLRDMIGIEAQMRKHGLWALYEHHYLRFAPVTAAMTRVGMPIHHSRRAAYAVAISLMHDQCRDAMQPLVPVEARRYSPKEGYKKAPTNTTALTEVLFNRVVVKRCKQCGEATPKRGHWTDKKSPCFLGKETIEAWKVVATKAPDDLDIVDEKEARSVSRKVLKAQYDALIHDVAEGMKRWAHVEPFIPSRTQLITYSTFNKHKLVMVGKGDDRKVTTNEKALKHLMGQYRQDLLYPLCLDDREYGTLKSRYLGTYEEGKLVKGFPVGPDGRVHTVFTNNPDTYRMSSVSPNLQNLPRIAGNTDFQAWVRDCFVAGPGKILWGVDYTGIEAVLVGWFMQCQRYVRLAKLGVHDFFNAHLLVSMKKLLSSDLPDLKWSDVDLKGYFKALKARFKPEREVAKRCVHGGNYMMTPKRMYEEYPEFFSSIKAAATVRGIYYEVFPEIPAWHMEECQKVHKTCVVKNPFGFPHRYYRVLNWEKIDGKWECDFGDDAKRLIAFLPQSTARFIIAEAGMRIFYDHPEVAPDMRLFVHDEILGESGCGKLDAILNVVTTEMGKSIPQLPLNPAWGMGPFLQIGTEAKHGDSWGTMQ